MEDREEEKSRCKKCNAIIDKKYDYCKICNDEENKEIAVMNKHPDNFRKTIDFYKIKLVDMFNHPKKKKIILTFTKNNTENFLKKWYWKQCHRMEMQFL